MKAEVFVSLKPTILDAQGAVIQKALLNLGYGKVSNVRIGKYIELEIDDEQAKSQVEEMCEKLLANTLIENYRVETAQ